MESRKERFIRIAENRTNKIIDMIRSLSNCSNKINYDYSEEDVKKIFVAIDKELKTAKLKFTENDERKFTLRKSSP